MNINECKIGDRVRIIMCCYPTPNQYLLGKVSEISEIIKSVNHVKLSRWGVNVNVFFIKKVDKDAEDIEMELNKETKYDIRKNYMIEDRNKKIDEILDNAK